jgi:lysozyme
MRQSRRKSAYERPLHHANLGDDLTIKATVTWKWLAVRRAIFVSAPLAHLHEKVTNMTLRMSADGRAQLIRREGFKTKAYRDSVGVWTIGVGHTSAAGEPKVTPGLVISKAQVDEILSRDLVQYERAVHDAVCAPLTQGQFDALVSFCFNVGIGGFKGSTVVKRVNSGDYKGAADALLLWNKPKEIGGRRKSERAQFLAATPEYDKASKRGSLSDAVDLHENETVTTQYLRAAGSRTIKGADEVKRGLGGIGVSLASADYLASQIGSVSGQIESVVSSVSSVSSLGTWAGAHWKLIALVILLALAAYFASTIWRGASLVTRARVDDARLGVNIGR